jgi:hypothetical protein
MNQDIRKTHPSVTMVSQFGNLVINVIRESVVYFTSLSFNRWKAPRSEFNYSISNPHDHFNRLYTILILVVTALTLFYKLEAYPRLWFDEGYKLNAAFTVAQDGIYGTYTVNGYVPFDPGTSGGPADILPTALALKLFGNSIFSARLTSVLYTLLASFSLYQIGRYLWGNFLGLFCALLTIAMPPVDQVSFILMGRQSLSEAATLSLSVFGIWILIYTWRVRSLRWSVLSGLLMGFGILSKTQLAIGLVPALLVVGTLRWTRERKNALLWLSPWLSILVVFLLWSIISRLLTPSAIQQENSTLLMDAIKTNIFTPLLGSNLDTSAFLVIGVTLLGVVTSMWRISRSKSFADAQWIELILALFALFMTVWFAVFSVGWVRYAYGGLVIGLFLSGRFVWDILSRIFEKWAGSQRVAILVMVCLALGINIYAANRGAVDPDAQNAAQYISKFIPQDAIIETWEWELDMLSSHRQYHHPPQAILFEAIRQSSYHQLFHLTYNALESNPEYLIVGTFAAWTGIYDSFLKPEYFNEIATYGVYHIYKRVRSN